MAGLIIYGSYGQFYSFVIADDKAYEKASEDLADNPNAKILFDRGDLTLQQIEDSRKTKNKLLMVELEKTD